MHRGSVVPQDQVAESPLMAINVVVLYRVSPEGVKKCLAFLQWLAQNVGVTTTAQIQIRSSSNRVCTDNRVWRAHRMNRVIGLL